MRIGVGVFKINDLTFLFSADKPRFFTSPNSPGIGHDADPVIANNEGGRRSEERRVGKEC